MLNLIQLFALIFSLFALSRVVLRTKDAKLTVKEFLFWTLVWVSLLGIVFFPKILEAISTLLGIGRPIDVIIYLSIGVLYYMLFRLYVKFEEREQEITKVVRELALLWKRKK